eukprot:15455988-Alexandrium_andersonii.AAC.1
MSVRVAHVLAVVGQCFLGRVSEELQLFWRAWRPAPQAHTFGRAGGSESRTTIARHFSPSSCSQQSRDQVRGQRALGRPGALRKDAILAQFCGRKPVGCKVGFGPTINMYPEPCGRGGVSL